VRLVKTEESSRDQKNIRSEANKSLVERLKAGDPLKSPIDHVDTWWPPRPIIKKDPEGMSKLYNIEDGEDE
jgi:hypothetical protein